MTWGAPHFERQPYSHGSCWLMVAKAEYSWKIYQGCKHKVPVGDRDFPASLCWITTGSPKVDGCWEVIILVEGNFSLCSVSPAVASDTQRIPSCIFYSKNPKSNSKKTETHQTTWNNRTNIRETSKIWNKKTRKTSEIMRSCWDGWEVVDKWPQAVWQAAPGECLLLGSLVQQGYT